MSNIICHGNVTNDPVNRYTPAGTQVVEFGLAENRNIEREGVQVPTTDFYNVKAWRSLGANVVASLKKGDRVLVHGRMERRDFVDANGVKQQRWDLVAYAIGASLQYAKADITKTAGRGITVPPADGDETGSGEELVDASTEPF